MRKLSRLFSPFIAVVFVAAAGLAGTLLAAAPARAQNCPGNPNALGTSRVLAIEPGQFQHLGSMQYHETLPLADKEVVLTFDDGPLPPYSNQILDILAAECVKATYFLVGTMAHEYPAVVRRIHEAGHTIGTHSESHPLRFQKLSVERVREEIDQGIADVVAALGDSNALAPFFRIPGLAHNNIIEEELAARSLVVFSSDSTGDDWHHHIRPRDIISRAMSRLEKRGNGILLLHDIHRVTVAALPGLLKELKDKGFHIVHIIPGERPGRIETAGEPPRRTDEPLWPSAEAGRSFDRIVLPAPELNSFAVNYRPWPLVMLADNSGGTDLVSVANAVTHWMDTPDGPLADLQAQLPAPDLADIGLLPQ